MVIPMSYCYDLLLFLWFNSVERPFQANQGVVARASDLSLYYEVLSFLSRIILKRFYLKSDKN
jgi:hypothetical protein